MLSSVGARSDMGASALEKMVVPEARMVATTRPLARKTVWTGSAFCFAIWAFRSAWLGSFESVGGAEPSLKEMRLALLRSRGRDRLVQFGWVIRSRFPSYGF